MGTLSNFSIPSSSPSPDLKPERDAVREDNRPKRQDRGADGSEEHTRHILRFNLNTSSGLPRSLPGAPSTLRQPVSRRSIL
eukprot:762790-Hanusia_phi.AAC.10